MAVYTESSQPSPGSVNSNHQSSAIPHQNSSNLNNPSQSIPSTSAITSSLTALYSQPQISPTSSNSPAQNKYRPLNVRDALSYLDQVKIQFQDLPGVYNRFLDIMKDFKTQMIDTPGVIDGVSSLFRGHPSLIQGFNTFLPPGYRIDVSQGDGSNQTGPSSAYSLITVTHPMGIQTQKRVPLQTGGEDFGSHVVPDSSDMLLTSRNEKLTTENVHLNSSKSSNNINPSKPLNEPPSAPVVMLKSKSITLDVIANLNRNPSPAPSNNHIIDQSKPGVKPLEFNHAINYVNKIKNRYAGEPKIYQTFLDILQTYQRDARPIQEVYEQVNQLFRGAPDLMTEFMQFLPDPSVNASQIAAADSTGIALLDSGAAHFNPSDSSHKLLSNSHQNLPSSSKRSVRDSSAYMHLDGKYSLPSHTGTPTLKHEAHSYTSYQHSARKRGHGASTSTSNGFTTSNAHHTLSGSRSHAFSELIANRTGELNGELNSAGHLNPHPTRGVKRKHRLHGKLSDPATSGVPASGLPPPGFAPPGCATIGEAYHAAVATNQILDRAKRKTPDHSSRNARPSDRNPKQTIDVPPKVSRTMTGQEELSFFYHLKTYFDNPSTYVEFLKIINLFTQDLIDLETLVSKIKPFLVNCPELFSRFQEIVGWKDEPDMLKNRASMNGPLSQKKTRPQLLHSIQPYEASSECGPSYRFIPDTEILSNCSGRDALCWDVLNDKLICSAPGTNEDSQTFLPRQTNAFERALYQAEDERHEYDYHIEANVRTIALLEPIHLRIQQMDPETRAEYRLKPGLGGQSKSVYQRIIKKIYGKQQGQEVIQALHENPALAVPIVLSRLKQKDEEWKRALRDWNRVWREVDGKNYWKALDHQGISFKALDKKVIGNKNLINEIELIKREQQNKQQLLLNPSLIRNFPKYQLELELQSTEVFYDVLKIFIHFLDHVPTSTGLDDAYKDQIEAHLKSIVTIFFNITPEEFDKRLTPLPPERKGASNENINNLTTKAVDANGNETAFTEGDASDTAISGGLNQPGDDERPEGGAMGRPSRGLSSGRRRAVPAKDGVTSSSTATSDLRKRAMKNASISGGVIHSERALARRNESNKKASGSSRAPRITNLLEETSSSSRAALPTQGISKNPSFDSRLSETSHAGAANGSSFMVDQKHLQANVSMINGEKNIMDPAGPSSQTNSGFPLSSTADNIDKGMTNYPITTQSRLWPSKSNNPQNSSRAVHQQNGEISAAQHRLSFFANNGYYCFFRLLHILYTRFKTLKLASMTDMDHHFPTKSNQIPTPGTKSEDNHSNTKTMTSPLNGLDENSFSLNPYDRLFNSISSYQQLLATVEGFNAGAIDQNTFEEECRNLFGIKGYLVVTVDKVCQALIKVLSTLSDQEESKNFLQLFKNQKKNFEVDPTSFTNYQKLSYRRSVESITGKGHESKVYRFEWVPEKRTIRIQLLGGDEISPEDFDNIEKAWSNYLASFQDMSVERTLGLENFTINPPFLKRNINLVKKSTSTTMTPTTATKDYDTASAKGEKEKKNNEGLLFKEENFITETGLEIRICIRSYRMFFNPNKTELLMRKINKKQ